MTTELGVRDMSTKLHKQQTYHTVEIPEPLQSNGEESSSEGCYEHERTWGYEHEKLSNYTLQKRVR